jgi:hypothetical protein
MTTATRMTPAIPIAGVMPTTTRSPRRGLIPSLDIHIKLVVDYDTQFRSYFEH